MLKLHRYLNGNCISYVEGLQEMKQLEELHLANQTPEGSNYSQITFDPEVTSTLRVNRWRYG